MSRRHRSQTTPEAFESGRLNKRGPVCESRATKRRRSAALQDAPASHGAPDLPPGFGLRRPSAAFATRSSARNSNLLQTVSVWVKKLFFRFLCRSFLSPRPLEPKIVRRIFVRGINPIHCAIRWAFLFTFNSPTRFPDTRPDTAGAVIHSDKPVLLIKVNGSNFDP
jgi:hypothetical protein